MEAGKRTHSQKSDSMKLVALDRDSSLRLLVCILFHESIDPASSSSTTTTYHPGLAATKVHSLLLSCKRPQLIHDAISDPGFLFPPASSYSAKRKRN